MRDRADSFTPSDEWGSFQFTTSADAKRAEHMFNQLSSERDALKALNAELVEALTDIRAELEQANGGKGPSLPLSAHVLGIARQALAKASK